MSWQSLTIRLKQEVVGLLDYESRCNLRLSSKDDKDVVDSTKFKFKKVRISETHSQMSEGKTIIRCEMDSLTIWLIGKENLTRIDRGWNGEIIEELSEIKHEHRYEIFHRFLESWNEKKNGIHAESIEIDSVQFSPPPSIKPKCATLAIFTTDEEHYMAWMRKFLKVSKNFEKLHIVWCAAEEGFTRVFSGIQVTKSFYLEQEMNMTDEEFDKFEALDLKISLVGITVDGVRRKLEKFLKFGRKTDTFDVFIPRFENFDAKTQLFPNEWILKETVVTSEEGSFVGKIIGGFKNDHGIQDSRLIGCYIYADKIQIKCEIEDKLDPPPSQLYPF